MIFLFVVDTSVSMFQRTSAGITLLDCAKSAVEHFVRCRDSFPRPDGSRDKYLLVTTAEGESALRADWRSSQQTFLDELKGLKAGGLTRLGSALTLAFDVLNFRRFLRGGSVGVDNFGAGRLPWMIEPAVLVSLLDGTSMTDDGGIVPTLTLPASRSPGAELVVEPFRWDQRVYSVILRIGGALESQNVSELGAGGGILGLGKFLSAMADVTGGQSYVARTLKELLNTMELIAVRSVPGVVLNIGPFVEPGDESTNVGHAPRSLMYVRSSSGHWPIPEAFRVTASMQKLPTRTAHPVVHFVPVDVKPFASGTIPVDRYELAPSPFTRAFCSSAGVGKAWLAYVQGSNGAGLGSPFGAFIHGAGEDVVLFEILPYSFPVLESLLQRAGQLDLRALRREMEEYLSTVPFYYVRELSTILARTFSGAVDVTTPTLSRSIVQYLERVRAQAARTGLSAGNLGSRGVQVERNAFKIPRESLSKHIALLKANLVAQGFPLSSQTASLAVHSVRISEMGDYREKEWESLRPVDEERAARARSAVIFGNPFRRKRLPSVAASLVNLVAVDEADTPVAFRGRGGLRDRVRDVVSGGLVLSGASDEAAVWPRVRDSAAAECLPVESPIGNGLPGVSFGSGSGDSGPGPGSSGDFEGSIGRRAESQSPLLSEQPFYGVLALAIKQMRSWGGSGSDSDKRDAILSLVCAYGQEVADGTGIDAKRTTSRLAASERGRLAELSAQYAQRFLQWRLASQLRDCVS